MYKSSLDLFAVFSLIKMTEVVSGSCSICFEKINATEKGISCKDCFRRFHVLCSRSDLRQLRSSNSEFCCQQCASSKKVLRQLEKLKEVPTKLDDLLKDYNQFKIDVQSDMKSLETSHAAMKENIRECNKRSFLLTKTNYRHDLIISGIPTSIHADNLVDMVSRIASVNNQLVTIRDLSHLTRLKNGSILVKFVSILVKEEIMKSYLRAKNLILSQITDINISSRVYLNNNYPPASQKIMAYCRKLKKSGLIKKSFMNHNDGTVTLTNMDNSSAVLSSFEDLVDAYPISTTTDTDG